LFYLARPPATQMLLVTDTVRNLRAARRFSEVVVQGTRCEFLRRLRGSGRRLAIFCPRSVHRLNARGTPTHPAHPPTHPLPPPAWATPAPGSTLRSREPRRSLHRCAPRPVASSPPSTWVDQTSNRGNTATRKAPPRQASLRPAIFPSRAAGPWFRRCLRRAT